MALALSSFVFILLASITGIILAFEPIAQKSLPYKVSHFDSISLAEGLPAIRKSYPEITEITVDHNQFVILNGTDKEGESVTVYIDPRTGRSLGVPVVQNSFFEWVTAFHRSLFLKELGRFFIGITSFLLLLIALSGTVLVIQRQRGVKRFFTRIVRENFAQYYHVVLGRLSLIPIIIIAITGTYLSLERFGIFETQQISHNIDFESISTESPKSAKDFPVFRNTVMGEVQSVEFPFSEDPEDYFTLKLKDREIVVNQINGDILSEVEYNGTTMATVLSLDLHTGRTSSIWSIILAIATINILFFIYSGFAITLKRRSNNVKNKFRAEESRFIILVGSENGNTFRFANTICTQLLEAGEQCFIGELNSYTTYPKAEHIIVLTATYGLGDAPTNARKFLDRLEQKEQLKRIKFSVLGFGSHAYPDFCKFAFEVDNKISMKDWATQLLEVHTVNDRSPEQFMHWATHWAKLAGVPMNISEEAFQPKLLPHKLTVIGRTEPTLVGGAFLVTLKPSGRVKYTSGDLLAIHPADDHRERLYSIGKVNEAILLSVKLYENGLGSGFLNALIPGQTFKARIDKNSHFHFPNDRSAVIMISNGTGIAPFLGMIDQNKNKKTCVLYCGFRNDLSFSVYRKLLNDSIEHQRLNQLNVAFSREGEKKYVKDIIARDEVFVARTLDERGAIMICGSLAMQQNVIELLQEICQRLNGKALSFYQSRGQILTDCY